MLSTAVSLENRILAALPCDEYLQLAPHLEHVFLPSNKVLYSPGEPAGYAYFPRNSVASFFSVMKDGMMVEVGTIGSEGMVGIFLILGAETTFYDVIVQVAGGALRIRSDQLKSSFKQNGALQNLLLRYTYALLTQVRQSSGCNRFHTVEQRLARWLLMLHDRVESDSIMITHESLARMLGTHRPDITIAALNSQAAGLIRYSRGKIIILNRRGLEAVACECYMNIKDGLDRFLNV